MVTKEEKIKKIDEFLKELDRLSRLNYEEAKDDVETLKSRLKSFLKVVFKDWETRYDDCCGDILESYIIDEVFDEGKYKERKYQSGIKSIKRNLLAYKEELQFQDEISQTPTKTDKIEKEFKEKQLESKRRQSVAETKFYGASIEMIDLLRKELKDRSKTNEDIIEINRDIKEIKDILNKISPK